MIITFISNYFNHHQKFLSDVLFCRENYYFISTGKMKEEREKLGYKLNIEPKYALKYFEKKETCKSIINNSNVIIIGSVINKIENHVLDTDKLIFKYSERPLKKGNEPLKYLPRLFKWRFKYATKKNVYLLCASAFTALDYSKFGLFKNRSYKWGYFPETKRYDIEILTNSKNYTEILWCGRFIDWKHPEHAVQIAERLKAEGYNFSLKFIGTGQMEDVLKSMVKNKGLQNNIIFTGPMSPEKVRENMEIAGIYLFTSDRQEGWGAVLNEAMNSGCAVIASHLAGATPYLVKNNINGIVYESENVDMLYDSVKYLLDNPSKQKELGRNAYETIITEWNADMAAKRFINLSNHIMKGEKKPNLYTSGPCSRAEIIKESWFKQ